MRQGGVGPISSPYYGHCRSVAEEIGSAERGVCAVSGNEHIKLIKFSDPLSHPCFSTERDAKMGICCEEGNSARGLHKAKRNSV